MKEHDSYRTLKLSAKDEFTEKRSRFIGYACPVTTEKEALDFISGIKSKHWDAKHNVYAFCLREGNICRYSDDGEPSGTAGMPVLGVIQKSGLTDCAIVVTRYFGGILLGGGGLVRAYSHAASIGIAAAGIITMRMCVLCDLVCDYNQYGRIASLISDCGGAISESVFSQKVTISFSITHEDLNCFEPKLADATGGSVTVNLMGEDYFSVSDE